MITAYEQASIAWHEFWELYGVKKELKGLGHRREASQQLTSRPIKRERVEVTERALMGLQRIYHHVHAKPRSEGQAAALQLVHYPSARRPLIVVLPTSSGKSALFFSVAAMAEDQTVIVVVPFAALVDDIMVRGQAAGLHCEEWKDAKSGHELQQLIVVSADRAVQGEFLHYAKGLELQGQLSHVFFDEIHVALTDTSYRERLRDLWTLRYLDCPFTGLTATLIVALEEVLKERLCIDNAEIFRRSTARKTIRYQVRDSQYEPPSDVAVGYARSIVFRPQQRGVIYVRSYDTGRFISDALTCPFYRARADDKGEVLKRWEAGDGGWIVATGALGTGVNIEGIRYVIHVGRPYGLTSFVQQSGRGGRNGEVSESMIITRVEQSSGHRRSEVMSEYSVEQVDEDAMTEFIQSTECRRRVLGRHMDRGVGVESSCSISDSVYCDRCRMSSRVSTDTALDIVPIKEEETEVDVQAVEPSGHEVIAARLHTVQQSHEDMMDVMGALQGGCIYCRLIHANDGPTGPHTYMDCPIADASGCGMEAYEAWRDGKDLGRYEHCFTCGLSQKICRAAEDDGWCEYPNIMLPGIFILHQRESLHSVVEAVGYQGTSEDDLWEWMKGVKEGFGREWESNWMGTWRMICVQFKTMFQQVRNEE